MSSMIKRVAKRQLDFLHDRCSFTSNVFAQLLQIGCFIGDKAANNMECFSRVKGDRDREGRRREIAMCKQD